MYLVNAAVKNIGLTSHSLCNAEHIVCSCRNKRTKDFSAFRFEQVNIFLRTIVVALYGQLDFLLNRSSVHNRLRFFRFPDSIVCQSAYYLHIRRTKFKTAQFISSDPSQIIMLKQNRLTIGQ